MDYSIFIKNQLEKAADIARKNFGKIGKVEKKEGDNNQILTETDIEVGNFLVNNIKSKFPEHNIIDEEAGVIDNGSKYTWTVDPIDGTSNFAVGLPMYGILLGLLEENTPIAGGIALPAFEEIYFAQKNKGAYCNGKKVKVSTEKNLSNALISYGIDGHPEDPDITNRECNILEQLILNIRNLRTSNSAYDSAMVAQGRYGAYINQTSKIWDNVAQDIIIQEAGGIYKDILGNDMDYSQPIEKANNNFTYIAAAPGLYRELKNILNSF